MHEMQEAGWDKKPSDTEIKGKAGILAAVKGVCPDCGTTVFRIVGKKK